MDTNKKIQDSVYVGLSFMQLHQSCFTRLILKLFLNNYSLLLDEPTSTLDNFTEKEVINIFQTNTSFGI